METFVINIPEKKSALLKQLLKELGVTIDKKATVACTKSHIPNALTAKTIRDARNGIGLEVPITIPLYRLMMKPLIDRCLECSI